MLNVVIASTQDFLFSGRAQQVILPGELGVFEVGPFHRPLMSRLLPGLVIVDDQRFPILRGVVKVESDTVTAIVEPELATHETAPSSQPSPPAE